MESEALLIWGMVFGSIGLGFFIYGKKQKAPVPLTVGIALFALPYFVSNLTQMFVVGVLLIVAPYFAKRWL